MQDALQAIYVAPVNMTAVLLVAAGYIESSAYDGILFRRPKWICFRLFHERLWLSMVDKSSERMYLSGEASECHIACETLGKLTMLDMFEGEGAKRAPGDLNFGKRFLPENKAEADELAMKAAVGSRMEALIKITFVLVRLRNQRWPFLQVQR